jgi:putative ABC transport system permease protein
VGPGAEIDFQKHMRKPPRWADRFLEWYCKPELIEDLQGDLHERFNHRVKNQRLLVARLMFVIDVFSFFRPYTLRKTIRYRNPMNMIRPFYQIAVRVLLKRRLYSIINVSGLVLGMTSFLLISIYVLHENSYDGFHEKKDHIFRLKLNSFSNGAVEDEGAGVGAAVGSDLKTIFPEIQKYVTLRRNQVMLSHGEKVFRETGVFFGSEDFFTMFSIPLIKGVDSLALREPWKIAVSESFGRKYFGDENPIGKILTNTGRDKYEVTAVFKDIPENSHLKIDAVFSFSSLELIFGKERDPYLTNWGWVGYPTYIELDPSTDFEAFDSKLKAAVKTKTKGAMSFDLQPIQSIHLNSHFSGEIAPNGDRKIVDILTLVAGLILVMAWINYISLTTARSLERAKEVGIRKVMGSSRGQLVGQFIFESLLYNVIATIITILLVKLFLPQFSLVVGRDLNSVALLNLDGLKWVLLFLLTGVLFSGLYPALVISSQTPAHVSKSSFKVSTDANILRKTLVVTQFATAVVLISGSIVIKQQLQHMQKSPIGIDLSQVLVVEGPMVTDSLYDMRFRKLRDEVMEYPGVQFISSSSSVPGRPPRSGSGDVRLQRQASDAGNSFSVFFVDNNFVETFSLDLKAGRDFSPEFNDGKSIMVNETGMHALGITDPQKVIGEKVLVYGDVVTVVGVINDYHYESLREHIEPAVYWYEEPVSDFYSFRMNAAGLTSSLVENIEHKFKEQFPDNQFIYFFLDDLYNMQYRSEQQFLKAFDLFATLGILIACMGLYGLSSYIILLRWKEIAIRKVLGASVKQIVVMVSREFLFVVLLADIIAVPVAWWLSVTWLSNYSSRIEPGLLFLAVPAITVLILAILTVGSQATRAARKDPAVVIREN